MALHVFYWTDSIVALASTSKKPSNDTLGNLSKYIREKAKEIDDKFLRPRKIENHAKAVKEGVGACFWFLTVSFNCFYFKLKRMLLILISTELLNPQYFMVIESKEASIKS